ncbi:MAG: helix-turn-helix domain-containing protein [bacterium]
MDVSRDNTERLLNRNEVMKMLNISKAGFYRLVYKREIPFYKVGGGLRFSVEDILSYLKNNRVPSIHEYKKQI